MEVSHETIFSYIGTGQTIGEIIQEIIPSLSYDYVFDNELTIQNIESLLREALRTCNPNDKKFNIKKYGDAYEAGCRAMVQEMGNGLVGAFRTYIETLNQKLSMPLFDIKEKITIKEYAAIGKNLATAASLYQSIAQAHQPNSENTFNILPALDNSNSKHTEIDAPNTEKTLPAPVKATLPTPSDTPKALVSDTSKNTETDD